VWNPRIRLFCYQILLRLYIIIITRISYNETLPRHGDQSQISRERIFKSKWMSEQLQTNVNKLFTLYLTIFYKIIQSLQLVSRVHHNLQNNRDPRPQFQDNYYNRTEYPQQSHPLSHTQHKKIDDILNPNERYFPRMRNFPKTTEEQDYSDKHRKSPIPPVPILLSISIGWTARMLQEVAITSILITMVFLGQR